ncbi:MAG TPA: hypothetical protein EYH23_02345 [Euryarchaeota archaeon]|nr:hypothetical protein [Euryarchaeota archaeon]
MLTALLLEYVSHWNTELVYLLFLITFLTVGAVFVVSGQADNVIIAYEGYGFKITVRVLDTLLAVLAVAFLVFIWAQYRRESLENYLREILRRRYKE